MHDRKHVIGLQPSWYTLPLIVPPFAKLSEVDVNEFFQVEILRDVWQSQSMFD